MGLHPYENPVMPPAFAEAGNGTPLRSAHEVALERAAEMQRKQEEEAEAARLAEEEAYDDDDDDEEAGEVETPEAETHDMSTPEGYGALVMGGTYAGSPETAGADSPDTGAEARERALNSLAMDNMDVVEGGADTDQVQPAAPVPPPAPTQPGDAPAQVENQTAAQPAQLASESIFAPKVQDVAPAENYRVAPGQEIVRYDAELDPSKGQNLPVRQENQELAKKEEKPFLELKPQSMEKPLEERLQYAEDLVKQLEERDAQRVEDRFKVNAWKPFKFMEKGLTAANKWLNNTDAGKVTKVIGKLVLGAGAFAASAAAGPALAPLLFAMGTKTYSSAIVESVQDIFCGFKKNPETGKWEVSSSSNDRLKLEALKKDMFAHAKTELDKVRKDHEAGLFTEDQLAFEISRIADDLEVAERKVIDEENRVIKSEKARERFRGAISTASTLALGLFGGVPLGTHNYDTDSVKHAVNWSIHGFGFNYHPGELAGTMTNSLANIHAGTGLTTYGLWGGQVAHSLGSTPPELYAGMIAGGAGLAAKTIAEMGRPRSVGSPELQKAMMTWYGSPDGPPTVEKDPNAPQNPEQPGEKKPEVGGEQKEYKETPSETLDKAKELAQDHMEGKPVAKESDAEEEGEKPAVEEVVSPEKEKSTFKADFENWLNNTAAGGGKAAKSQEVKKFLWWAGVTWHEENGQVKLDNVDDLVEGVNGLKRVMGRKGKTQEKKEEKAAAATESAPAETPAPESVDLKAAA